MTLRETREFLERMKVYYPNMIIDDYTTQEWHSQLREYSNDDINDRFNDHLRNEEYSKYIPKISFLTNYIVKEKDKGNARLNSLRGFCPICRESVLMTEYEQHYRRCSHIEYIIRQVKRFKGVEYTYNDIATLSEEKFNSIYEKVLNLTYEKGEEKEKQCIDNYRECLANGGLCNKDINGIIN